MVRARAIPRATATELEAWPAIKASWTLSDGLGNPATPPYCLTTSSPKKEYKPLLAQLTDQEGEELCAQLRRELVEDVSSTGGHLASNLGAVELTVALHRVFDTSVDRLVFDVGHQCYTHKMLTSAGSAF